MLPGCPTTLQSGDKNTCLAFHRGRYSRSRIASADDLAEKEQYLLRCFGFNLPPSHPIPENGVGPPRALSAACAADLGVNDFRPRTPVSGVKEPVGRLCSVICWLEWKPMPGEEALSSLFDIEPAGMPWAAALLAAYCGARPASRQTARPHPRPAPPNCDY